MDRPRPNIVFVTSHDIGRHLACYGATRVTSPTFDRMAAEGVRFANAFCTSPICSPARASLVTGRYPHNHGVKGLAHPPFAWDLHDDETHLAQVLRRAGYTTHLAGLQHETGRREHFGIDEEINTHDYPGNPFAAEVAADCERFFAERATAPQPFYLQVGFFEPHRKPGQNGYGPYEPVPDRDVELPRWLKDEPSARKDVAQFQSAIRALDEGLARIFRALEVNGLDENTLVVFAADHGAPYPRAKASLYDPGLEIALLVRWPGGDLKRGHVSELPVSGIDVAPTILDIAGLEALPHAQGRSLAAELRGESLAEGPVFAENNFHNYWDPIRCIRTRSHKLIVNFALTSAFYDASQQWRPAATPNFPGSARGAKHPLLELYDLEADPLEHHNLADSGEHTSIRDDLLHQLAAWMHETEDFLLAMPPIEPRGKEALGLIQKAK